MGRLLILGGVLILGLVAWRWFQRTPPERVASVLRRAALLLGIAVLVLLAATGRLHWLFALVGSALGLAWQYGRRLLPLLVRFAPFIQGWFVHRRRQRATRGPARGNTSQVSTRFLRMSLDHDSGEMDGQVLEGAYQGRRLAQLALEDLMGLYRECMAADEESAALLEAYLDRVHGAEWRAQFQSGASGARQEDWGAEGPMSPHEAYEILGLSPGADRDAVIEAHRRLIQRLHPDRGGSGYLAAKINQAKDVLLGE